MALAGCNRRFRRFESLHPDNIIDARKKSPRPDDYARRWRSCTPTHSGQRQLRVRFRSRPADVFERTCDWIESQRLECATFHILTPYPGTPLHTQMKREDRLLHHDWDLYDTAHVVFRPKHMTARGTRARVRMSYERLFSHRSIWRRGPHDSRRRFSLPRDVVTCTSDRTASGIP